MYKHTQRNTYTSGRRSKFIADALGQIAGFMDRRDWLLRIHDSVLSSASRIALPLSLSRGMCIYVWKEREREKRRRAREMRATDLMPIEISRGGGPKVTVFFIAPPSSVCFAHRFWSSSFDVYTPFFQ